MGFLSRALGSGETRDLSTGNVLGRYPLGGGATGSGQTVTPDTALRHSDVYACVRVLSDTAASLPLHIYRRGPEGRERVSDTLTARLLDRPSPTMTQATFTAAVIANLNLWGNAFVAKFRDPNRPVQQLGIIHPSRVQVSVEAGEPVFRVAPSSTNGGAAGVYSRREILHVKGLTTDGVVGLSPLTQAAEAIGLGQAMQGYASRFFSQSAHPSGVLEHPGRLTPEAAERLRKDWEAKFRGVENSSRVAILEDGLSWRAISIPMHDAEFLAQRRYSATEIARVFRVPPYMIGADSGGNSMTYSNVEQELSAFLIHSVRPWLVAIEQAMRADDDLFPEGAEDYPEFVIDAVLRADTKTRAEVYAIATGGAAWLRPSEVRERENLGPAPELANDQEAVA